MLISLSGKSPAAHDLGLLQNAENLSERGAESGLVAPTLEKGLLQNLGRSFVPGARFGP